MPAVCFYFQVHQPYRLRRYTYFDRGVSQDYFDDDLNRSVIRRVATNCYVPANERILQSIERHNGEFKVAFSITGTAIEQMKEHAPEALESFKALARTGCVEFLGETYYHSLASLYDPREFREQVRQHSALILSEFGQKPKVFRNTELIYDDALGRTLGTLGFAAVIAEGSQDILGWRSPNFVYRVPETSTRVLLRNFKFSDDIAFRFSEDPRAGRRKLTPALFAQGLQGLEGNADFVGLFLDYETFGEHHREDGGILDFLSELPAHVLAHKEWRFATPSEAVETLHPVSELACARVTSWADVERDASAWCGNKMQQAALAALHDTRTLCGGREMYSPALESMLSTWRRLQTSDHFYYMSTKGDGDGDVHSYFSPFESPYDAFIAYMNVMKDIAARSRSEVEVPRRSSNA